MSTENIISSSLDLVAERAGDPTEAVYARLFAQHPDLEEHFVLDTDGGVRGSMLQHTFECILDLAGEKRMASAFIAGERNRHDEYGIPDETYLSFFAVVRDTIRDLLAEEWTDEMEVAWAALVTDVQKTKQIDL